MGTLPAHVPPVTLTRGESNRASIVVGITSAQTCLVLRGRLRALREAGFHVTLISNPGILLETTAAQEGVEFVAIPMKRGIEPFSDVLSLVRICRVLRRLHPDITEFSTPKAGLLGNLAAFLCGVRHRVYSLRGLRLETSSGLERCLLGVTEKIAAACSHVVLCNSSSLLEQACSRGLVVGGKARLLGHGSSIGVDVERFSPGSDEMRAKLSLPADALVIGFVGRLTQDKGVPELIDSFRMVQERFPQALLLLVGWYDKSEDALSSELRSRIKNNSRIVRTGFVANTAPYYRAMDLLVLPTRREGFPNVVLEAAASGIAVVTTTATGARDAVVPDVTGLLVPPGDSAALAEAIRELLSAPERRRLMGRAGRAWVMERFAQERVMSLTVALYRELLCSGTGNRARALVTGAADLSD